MKEVSDSYSIKDLEYFTGIKAHTIRIWEKRYSILTPERTDSNIRLYSEDELKRLLNIAYLNNNGFKISKIAKLDEDELNSTVLSVSSRYDDPNQEFHPGRALMSAIRFEEARFIETIEPYFEKHGFEVTYHRFLSHLLENSKILWQTGSLSRAQENFIRNTVKGIMLSKYHNINQPITDTRNVFAVINTSGTRAEIGLLFNRYVIRNMGVDVIYPGDQLPSGEIAEIYKMRPFNFLVMSYNTTHSDTKSLAHYSNIGKELGLTKIILTEEPQDEDATPYSNIIVAPTPVLFYNAIRQLI
jgi:MerR family transcriptional regulator, light-induced transcriptional regulator